MLMNDCLCNNRMRPEEVLSSRRQFLARCGMGLGALGLASLLSEDAIAAATGAGAGVKPTHFPAKARHVIHIFAQGAPSHIDTWDPKPALAKYEDQTLPDLNGVAMPSPFKFTKRGKSGIEVSEVFDALGNHVDDMAIIRSMHTDIPAHEVATVFMNTGSLRMAKPSMGSWLVYGLGTENQNLPGYIALRGSGLPPGGAANYQAAFLPGVYQGTSINTQAPSVPLMIQNIRNAYVGKTEQRRQLDFVNQLNQIHAQNIQRDAALETRLESYEIAFRMQAEAMDAFDISKEPADTQAAYGIGQRPGGIGQGGSPSEVGKQLLIARRLVERGVRVVQVWHQGWDHHA